jgi:hypothetical protein
MSEERMKHRNRSWIAIVAGVLALGACTAKVEDEGKAPDVDVNVNADSARLPDVDVDPANVTVGTDTNQVVTPDVDVTPVPDSAH